MTGEDDCPTTLPMIASLRDRPDWYTTSTMLTFRIMTFVLATLLAGLHPAAALAQDNVDITLETFGVSGHYRPGDFVPIRVLLKSNLSSPETVQVVWEVPEASGDIAEVMREVAVNTGVPVSVWLYARVLPSTNDQTVFALRVYRDVDGVRGEELGGRIVSPATAITAASRVSPAEGMIAIVGGTNAAGLDEYNVTGSRNINDPITGHEYTRLVRGLSVSDLPDRWEGLAPFEAVVWTSGLPSALRQGQADALREYIRRGGHLVIPLPSVGNDWGLGAVGNHPLHDLVPVAAPRTENVRLSMVLPIISKRRQIDERDDIEFPIRVFESFGNGYEPLIALPKPDGRVLSVQRIEGFGRVTFIGVELQSGQLGRPRDNRGGGLLEGDVVWNRVLGRRADTLHPTQFATLAGPGRDASRLNDGYRREVVVAGGRTILDAISLSGRAAVGIGLAFLLFVAYWLVAGPAGFAVLKSTKRLRHAWVAFFLTSAAFTLLAWGMVKVFGQKSVQVQHLTFLDIVSPPPGAAADATPGFRASMWFSVFLPGYGPREISIRSTDGFRDVLAPFAAPDVDPVRFPNVARYVLPVRSPASYEVPARATTKEMYARWMGTPEGDWAGAIEVVEPIEYDRRGRRLSAGAMGHNLPGRLTNVRLYLVQPIRLPNKVYRDGTGQDPILRTGASGQGLNVTQSWAIPDMEKGAVIRLDTLGAGIAQFDTEIGRDFTTVTGYEDDDMAWQRGAARPAAADPRVQYRLLTFFSMAPAPAYVQPPGSMGGTRPTIRRIVGRELDLSAWLARPCIIVMGELVGSETPVPLRVSDRPVESRGLTIVRWIYPLPVTADDVAEEPTAN